MSDASRQTWRSRLKDLEVVNAGLERLLVDAMVDNTGLKGLLAINS
ncbi:hypothetical protein [Roseovarius sp. D22-M7]